MKRMQRQNATACKVNERMGSMNRFIRKRLHNLAASLSVATGMLVGGPVHGAAITPGNILVDCRDGNGAALSSDAAVIKVLEYTPSGTLAQTMVMPSGFYGDALDR